MATPTLQEALDTLYPDMLAFTRDLVAIPTENPPGNYYADCAALLERKCRELDLAPRVIESPAPVVNASIGEGERVFHFHGHYDVVPHSVEGQFAPEIRGNNLFGRGSSDMKSGLAVMIYAARALQLSNTPLNGRVEIVMVPDEETGGHRGTGWLSQQPDFARGSIGMMTAEPTSGAVWNASRGAISLRVHVKGKHAHVGLSCQGINAFENMLEITRELENLKAEISQRESAYAIHPRAAKRSILMLGGECRGGSNFNVVPESCSFTVDRRLNPEEDLTVEKQRLFDIFDRIQARGIEHEVEIIQEGHAAGSPEDHPVSRILANAIEATTGKPPQFEMCPGLLENRFYSARGIPAFAYGPGLLSVSHGPNEFVPLKNIRDCAEIYARVASHALAL